MRRIAVRLSYIAIPIVAIVAFMFIQQQMDGLAPAPPASVPSTTTPTTPAVSRPQQPTVLAPEDSVDNSHQTAPVWPATNILQSSYDTLEPNPAVPTAFPKSNFPSTASAKNDAFLVTDPDKF